MDEGFAYGCCQHRRRRTLENLNSEIVFHQTYLDRQRRLRNMAAFGCFAEMESKRLWPSTTSSSSR